MAARSDVTLRFELSPRLAEIAAGSDAINVQDSHDTLTDAQDSIVGSEYPDLVSTAGGENLGGGTSVGLTTTLDNVQYAFESTNPLSSGTVTTADPTGVTLIDSTATFQTSGVTRGDWVINFTDQSVTEVLSVTSETELVTRGLRNGAANAFTFGHAFKVWEVKECTLTGGNFVAVDDVDADLNPLFTTFGRFATRTSSSSATLQELQDIQYAAFAGGIWLDQANGVSGTAFPIGTRRVPVQNLTHGLLIAAERGFNTVNVIGDADITADSSPDFTGFNFIGEGKNIVTFTIKTVATVLNCTFQSAKITGTADGDIRAFDCQLENLSNFCGVIEDSMLMAGTLTLGGGNPVHFIDCESGVPGAGLPIIDMGGTGQPLAMRRYTGGLDLRNKTGTDNVTLEFTDGQIILDSTITNADNMEIRGRIANYVDNSTGGTPNIDGLFQPVHIRELWRLQGLDIDNPMNVTPTQRSAGVIDLAITGDGVSTSTVTRQ